MLKFYHALVAFLSQAARQEVARTLQYYRQEALTYRELCPKHYRLSPRQRQRILKYGLPLGPRIKDVITIVSPRTFARWASGETKSVGKSARTGRPRTAAETVQLILRLARETGWGYTRILGELKKLGIRKLARSTVINVLRAGGFDPGPKRGEGTWSEFIERHAATLWQCDFFSKKVWTPTGLVPYFLLVLLHVGSRRVFVSSPTANPDSAWVTQQARNFLLHAENSQPPTILMRDHDAKFSGSFDAVFASESIQVMPVGPRAPNMNAFVERWIQSVQQECLDHFVILGERHLHHLVTEYIRYYHAHRPHQGLGNELLTPTPEPPPDKTITGGEIVCESRLGGLLKHYHRHAA
ncbi:MAG: transposase [Planctomycetes bacterium]|nr:transposase [Planctomycetota bacterium]